MGAKAFGVKLRSVSPLVIYEIIPACLVGVALAAHLFFFVKLKDGRSLHSSDDRRHDDKKKVLKRLANKIDWLMLLALPSGEFLYLGNMPLLFHRIT